MVAQRDIGKPHDAVQRRAHFVADVGEERAFCLRGRFGGLFGARQLVAGVVVTGGFGRECGVAAADTLDFLLCLAHA